MDVQLEFRVLALTPARCVNFNFVCCYCFGSGVYTRVFVFYFCVCVYWYVLTELSGFRTKWWCGGFQIAPKKSLPPFLVKKKAIC